jgi:hypothetical protein
MYERNLNEAELILRTQKKSLIPVREIWEEISRRSRTEGFEVATLADFSAMLEGDKRFQVIPAQMKREEEQESSPEESAVDTEMENLGFFSENQVRLRTTRAAEQSVSEEEEEVGSIRRRAFVSHAVMAKKITLHKQKTSVAPTKALNKEKKKKASLKKPHSQKARSTKRNLKTKIRRRGKK